MPWSYRPRPEAITVDPLIRARVVDLAGRDKVAAVRVLREETGLPLQFSVVLIDSWLDGTAGGPAPAPDADAAPAGQRLLDVVAVMDRLRSPGGCPWDAEQTHSSLRGYLLEEAHEAYDAIVDDDPAAMREELGDVLLQVVFHARVAAEASPGRRFDIDDVAGDLVDKLVRRHPHVFGDAVGVGGHAMDVAAVEAGWEEIKQAEKQRRSPTEGVSRSQPAASWGAALVRRAGRAGLGTPEPADLPDASPEALGERLLAVVTAAEQRGWDVEDALREAVRRYAGELDAEAIERSGAPHRNE